VVNKSSDPHDAAVKLKQAFRALITCHRNPDGDAFGSELALAGLAEKIGVKTVIINRDETPLDAGADLVCHESVSEALGQMVNL